MNSDGAHPPLHRQVWPYAGIAGPALALLLLIGIRRWRGARGGLHGDRHERARAAARRHLKRAEEFRRHDQPQAFYASIERAIRDSIGGHLNIPAQGLTVQELDGRLSEAGINGEMRSTVRDLLDTCERARFSPAPLNNRTMDDIYRRTSGCLGRLDTMLQHPTPGSSGGSV